LFVTLGSFADSAPYTSDYTYENIYYQSIRGKREDYLTVHDYLWRWDTDWFWCSKNVFAQHPLIRKIYGKERLGSRTYTKIMRWNSRVGATRWIERLAGLHSESVIQDVDIPLARAGEFFEFYAREIGLCRSGSARSARRRAAGASRCTRCGRTGTSISGSGT